MSDFRFAEPGWIHAFWGLFAFLALLVWLERRGGDALAQLVSAALQDRLVARPGPGRRRLRLALLGLCGACMILALMRPQWGLRYVPLTRAGAEIMIALDVSNSMLAEDVAPNRLERAKAEIADLLALLDGDQVGLIAFAGRASVLAPLTPDFGFLRLVLDGIGPTSASLGGTRLEEPIRKALAGFGPAGEASRALVLVTDGEDHDSFALDAAKAAAEQGVRIIAIGFGDEAGSEIFVRDPRSGARQTLRDREGNPVRSRLDGELLREIALASNGAYIPAGTGVLDLADIYERHIAPLTRGALGKGGKAVREEGYPLALLLALLFLVASAGVASRAGQPPAALGRAAALLLACALLAAPLDARAQTAAPAPPAPPAAAPAPAAGAAEAGATPGAAPETPAEPAQTPREIYNRGVAALGSDELDAADTWLGRARREGAQDGELRVRATYNLGMAAAERAESRLEKEPEEALKLFYTAGDWFREALRLRPDDADTRHNLEVVLRRALLVADELAKRDTADLAKKLEELVTRERAVAARVAERIAPGAGEPTTALADEQRRALRSVGSEQRGVLADADALASRAGGERDALEARPEAERTDEDAERALQLGNVLHYLHRARERMGQVRGQLRQRQVERAYRRSSGALAELKRAQDQLRNPVEVLDRVLADAAETATGAAWLAGAAENPPAWLTRELLVERQTDLSERTGELDERLRAALRGAPPADASVGDSGVAAAQPFVDAGKVAFTQAVGSLERGELEPAQEQLRRGITALIEARERFLGLRGLIETTYADERALEQVLVGATPEARKLMEQAGALAKAREVQEHNAGRGVRLEKLLEAEGRKLDAPPDPATAAPLDDAARTKERERLRLAGELLGNARREMDAATKGLGKSADAARAPVGRAVAALDALRRLFFTLVEQLKDTAQRQQELADATQDALAIPTGDLAPGLGPLAPRQDALARTADAIAGALDQQARAAGGVQAEEPDAAETSRKLLQAGEQVAIATGAMEQAVKGMNAAPPTLAPVRAEQDRALESLGRALALLAPPQQPPPDGDQQQDQQQPQEGGGESEPQGAQEQAQSEQQTDPQQLLQGVRDREAQRRREQAQRRRAGYESVEQDW